MITEVLIAIRASAEVIRIASEMLERARNDNREPTADEVAAVKAAQKSAEDRWAALAPK